MQDIIFQQRTAAKPLTGRTFLLSIAGILLRLAIAQTVINLLIEATGTGLLNLLFYGYAIALLLAFMRATVAGYVYTLKTGELVLERRLGDSTITLLQIPLQSVVSLREVRMAENLRITYHQVTHIDPGTRPPLRVRMAFLLSLISSHLARLLAGRHAQERIGHVLVYDEGKRRCACTFAPDEQMLSALSEALGERCGFDERMTHGRLTTLYARALERAFPALYPYVEPLVKQEDVAWAHEEIARHAAEKKARAGAGRKPGKARGEKPGKAGGKRAGQETGRQKDAAQESEPDGPAETQERTDAPRRRRKQE